MLRKRALVVTDLAESLGDVRRDRGDGTAHLSRQTKPLIWWIGCRSSVSIEREFMRLLPNLVLVEVGHFALGSSDLANI